jgi:outer membrane protein assembly factor BamA
VIKKAVLLLFLFLTLTKSLPAEEGQFVIVPLPFYTSKTGFGLILKMIHTNLGYTYYADSMSFATAEGQMATFNTIGQKQVTFFPNLFWSFTVGGVNSKSYYYGLGNHTDASDESEYMKHSYMLAPRLGLSLFGGPLKLYGVYIHSNARYNEFVDTNGMHQTMWDEFGKTTRVTNAIGYGVKLKLRDDRLRPTKGVTLSYEFTVATPSMLTTDNSFRRSKFDMAFYLPLPFGLTHATGVKLAATSTGIPKVDYPTLMIRGISKTSHKYNVSFAILNEERFHVSENWMIVPFWDFGKVQESTTYGYFKDLHLGYGIGFRYIINNALVARLDFGFSKGGENSVLFNYGHTF